MSTYGSSYGPAGPVGPAPHTHGPADGEPLDPAAEERAEAADRLGEELLAGRTARQDELAHQIYEQLKAGSEVDDIKHLIGKLSRAATEDAQDRGAVRQAGGGR
ncbi:hypothetical protein T261_7191 [Streptomyces lydicus]|nr:hypothetical protein T261_7191 [Streptomyces lydicus]